jgi:hypothetical protein
MDHSTALEDIVRTDGLSEQSIQVIPDQFSKDTKSTGIQG